jgi:hypothetical protein
MLALLGGAENCVKGLQQGPASGVGEDAIGTLHEPRPIKEDQPQPAAATARATVVSVCGSPMHHLRPSAMPAGGSIDREYPLAAGLTDREMISPMRPHH